MLVGQVSRVQYTVWEKAGGLVEALGALRGLGPDAHRAGCAAFADKLVQQARCPPSRAARAVKRPNSMGT